MTCTHYPIFNNQILSYENKLCFKFGDKNKVRHSGKTKSCISNETWKEPVDGMYNLLALLLMQTGQKMSLCFALSSALIKVWKKSHRSSERNPNRWSIFFLFKILDRTTFCLCVREKKERRERERVRPLHITRNTEIYLLLCFLECKRYTKSIQFNPEN